MAPVHMDQREVPRCTDTKLGCPGESVTTAAVGQSGSRLVGVSHQLLAGPEGIEPPTRDLEGLRSIR